MSGALQRFEVICSVHVFQRWEKNLKMCCSVCSVDTEQIRKVSSDFVTAQLALCCRLQLASTTPLPKSFFVGDWKPCAGRVSTLSTMGRDNGTSCYCFGSVWPTWVTQQWFICLYLCQRLPDGPQWDEEEADWPKCAEDENWRFQFWLFFKWRFHQYLTVSQIGANWCMGVFLYTHKSVCTKISAFGNYSSTFSIIGTVLW